MFKLNPDIKISRSHSEIIEVVEFPEQELFVEDSIMIDAAEAFSDVVSKTIVDELNIEMINRIEIVERENIFKLVVKF
jgi:hypothetical protein